MYLNYFRRYLTKVWIVSFGLVLAQRLSGVGGVIQYSTHLFKLSGSNINPNDASIILGYFQLIASGFSFILVDKVGRRTLLLVSSALVIVCLALITIYFNLLIKGILYFRKRLKTIISKKNFNRQIMTDLDQYWRDSV